MNKKAPTFSLKDQLFNKEKVEYIAWLIKEVYWNFSNDKFSEEVLVKFPELELTQRISHISEMFKKHLSDDFEESVNILLKSLPKNEENWTLDNNFWDFIFAPYLEYVATYGLDYIDKNLYWPWEYQIWLEFCFKALERMTQNFSSEFAIRHFFNSYEEETFSKVLMWSESENYHVRRLSSEGSRQKLPWWKGISLDYNKTIQVLDNLYCDNSRFVTRSVANHLNDISKIDAELVVKTLKKWKQSNDSSDIDYIISHSTRWLVKQWHKGTLELLWYSSNPKITVTNLSVKNNVVKIWDALEFEFNISSQKEENLIIDYKIYFQNKAWDLKPKVFKIKKLELKKSVKINKKHSLKMMTTKALYHWEHQVEIIINWKSFGKKSFELKK